jgi:hypothetical protein
MTNNLKEFYVARWVLILAALGLSPLGLNWLAPPDLNFDGDVLLQAIMSTQKVTLFYWGQDRFLSFYPFILSWITDIKLNLLAHMILMGMAYFLLLELISDTCAKLFSPDRRGSFRAIMFCFFVLVSLIVLGRGGLFAFAYAAQPYSTSFLFLGWAVTLLLKRKNVATDFLIITLLILVSIGLNPSILIAAFGITVSIFMFDRRPKLVGFAALAVGMFSFWGYVSSANALGVHHDNYAYSVFKPELLLTGLKASVSQFHDANGRWSWLGLLIAAFVIGFVVRTPKPSLRASVYLGLLGAFAVAWWVLFSMNQWVSMNLFTFRYYYPSIMVVLIVISLRFTQLFQKLPEKGQVAVSLILLVVILVVLIKPVILPKGDVDIAFDNVDTAFDNIDKYVAAQHAPIVAGDYWQVWPAVFRLNSASGRVDKPIYGAATRGLVMRPEMDSRIATDLRAKMTTKAVCIGANVNGCLDELLANTSFSWRLVEKGDCLDQCYLFEVLSML